MLDGETGERACLRKTDIVTGVSTHVKYLRLPTALLVPAIVFLMTFVGIADF